MSRVATGSWLPPRKPPPAEDDFDTPAALPAWPGRRELRTTVAWMDNEPWWRAACTGAARPPLGQAKVQRVVHRLDINTLAENASQLEPNAIGHVDLLLQEPLPAAPFGQARVLGSPDPGGRYRQPRHRRCRAGQLTLVTFSI